MSPPERARKTFDLSRHITAAVGAQKAYVPGDQPSESGWVKLNTNENPFPPSPRVAAAIRAELGTDAASLRLYPNPASAPLRAAAARYHGHGLGAENVLAGNGSDDVLNLLVRAFADASKPAGMLVPSYSLYPVLSGLNAAAMRTVPVGLDGVFDTAAVAASGANIFFLTNPNAPLGIAFAPEKIAEVLEAFDGLLVVDEAYAPFARADAVPLLTRFPNLVVTRTFSKAFALAGIRAGYALADAAVVAALDKVRDSYNLDRLAQAAAVAALEDRAYYDGITAEIKRARDAASAALRGLGWRVLPSEANFLMASPPSAVGKTPAETAAAVHAFFKSRKILVRYFPSNPVTAPFLRISVGSAREMETLLAAAAASADADSSSSAADAADAAPR
ncbi:MAG: histidinol-phosphate transaminase [Puniceicoccales bacterium]|jgi:histidinol-phosphate aminotransferase|nr:histidinol-phosphate transaminase [Puniceicoccales bacterium]